MKEETFYVLFHTQSCVMVSWVYMVTRLVLMFSVYFYHPYEKRTDLFCFLLLIKS